VNDEQRAIDSLRLHADAAMVPPAVGVDLRALRDSLRDYGQEDPIDITPDGAILDGRTRWALLRELGSTSIRVRVIEVPDSQQTNYIIDRALARRHLNANQKRALNKMMRAQVIEVREPSPSSAKRGKGLMRIGRSQTQRAAALGVDLSTVKEWDHVGGNPPTSALPTHAIDGRGRPQPIHKGQPAPPRDRALDTSKGRNHTIANAARNNLTKGLSTMAGVCHALCETNYGNVLAVASPEDVTAWRKQVATITRELRSISGRLKGN